jgi:2-polyprenyl-6-methoxyphenol hydroxylase-like FAD-dependent oxidoreductase
VLDGKVHPPLEDAPPSAGHATVLKRGKVRSASSQQTDCCIAGGGPAGLMLALLLARQGVRVTLLEAHRDFDREFRGNTINPSVMEVIEELGLADRLLGLRHAEIPRFTAQAAGSSAVFADFSRLKTCYPYMLMLPQARFLEFIAAEAQKYPNFRLVMGARVKGLIEEDGVICGVGYRGPDGPCEVHARLTIGADGRFSQIRRLASLQSVKDSPPDGRFLVYPAPRARRPEARGRRLSLRTRQPSGADGSLRVLAGRLHRPEGWLQATPSCRSSRVAPVRRWAGPGVGRSGGAPQGVEARLFIVGRGGSPPPLVPPGFATHR